MPKTPFKSLDQLFGGAESALTAVARKARQMAQLRQTVVDLLPDDVGRHIHGVSLKEDQSLVLLTESPAWANRLRYVESDLLNRLRQGPGLIISRIVIKVRPPSGSA